MPPSDEQFVFFSRGMGRGHAIPDNEIARAILLRLQNARIRFVSYGTGAETLRQLGWDVVDLGVPEHVSFPEMLISTIPLLSELSSDIVIAHEEYAPLCVAKAMNRSSLCLTDWFGSEELLEMQSLRCADKVFFLDDAGYYDEPSYLRGRVEYCGYVTGPLSTTPVKSECRRALDIPVEATTLLCAPGGAQMFSEERTPLFQLALSAYDLLPMEVKRLIWVCSDVDYNSLRDTVAGRDDIMLMTPHQGFSRTLQACDLLLTKGNRCTLFEGETLGIPSMSVSFGVNPIDDYRVTRMRSHIALRAKGLTAKTLRDNMLLSLTKLPRLKPTVGEHSKRVDRIADCIVAHCTSGLYS
jgi:hypothetical protein